MPLATWVDTVTTGMPMVTADRAFFVATDSMDFGGGAPPMQQTFNEGFLRNKDGSIGDHFIEAFGQVTVDHEISPGVFTYAQPAAVQELQQLGFTTAVDGTHVTTKVVILESGTPVEHVTRLSTVHWKDASGADKYTQLVTLQGEHRHTAS
jgi:hypothetical protein